MAEQTDTIPPSGVVKNIVILGGSYGGVSTAHYLLKHVLPKLPERESYRVVLVSASSQAMCRPACPRALISDAMFAQDKLFVNIPAAFEEYGKDTFRFVHGTATALDHSQRTVTISQTGETTETVEYYALQLASVPGCVGDARTIVVAGGGPAGIETAGELGEHLNGRGGAGWFNWWSKSSAPRVKITVVSAGAQILPVLRRSIAQQAEIYLEHVGVTVRHNVRVQSTTPDSAGTDLSNIASPASVHLDDGTVIDADLYIPATGSKPNTSFMHSSLLNASGHVETDTSLRVKAARPRVYAVGDVASYARPAIHLLLEAIPVLCANIKRDLLLASSDSAAAGEDRLFKEDTRETQMVPIGKSKGVGAAMGYHLPSFMVWLIKGRDYWLWTTGALWSGKQWVKES